MLLPAFGDPRLTRKQGAEILERSPLGRHDEQRRCNGGRCGFSPPPTPKRNCQPFAHATPQRPATAPPPGGDNATDFFMARLTLRRC